MSSLKVKHGMKPIAPGTIIFHRYRGYGVLTAVNLLTGWVSARFGNEQRTLDLNLSADEVQHADGEPILFRLEAPDRMPHAKLMAMVKELHKAGYERLYLYSWPNQSGMHWRWHLFTGTRDWMNRPWREGWYGSGANYIFNPVMGWGDNPGATTEELIETLAKFDAEGLAQALGQDEEHTQWFKAVCDELLPGYMYSLNEPYQSNAYERATVPVYPVRRGLAGYSGPALPWPPGWHKKKQKEHHNHICRSHFFMV